jgi:DNA end-binding protein Ku
MPSSVWKGYLSFGLVSFPVRLSAAARPKTVHFHMLHKKDLSRIKEVWYCAAEDKPVSRADIVKGYEVEKGEYVVVEDSELKRIAPPTSNAMEIVQFVRADQVDPLYFEKSYYVIAEDAASKPCRLLLSAMKETSYYALGKVAMHGREHIVLIRPRDEGMVLHTMYFVDELQKGNEGQVEPKGKLDPKEMKLAKQLIETLASPFEPSKFEDEYRKNTERLIELKRKGQKITSVKQSKRAPVVDIMHALQQSLKQSAAREQGKTSNTATPAKRTAKRRTRAA